MASAQKKTFTSTEGVLKGNFQHFEKYAYLLCGREIDEKID